MAETLRKLANKKHQQKEGKSMNSFDERMREIGMRGGVKNSDPAQLFSSFINLLGEDYEHIRAPLGKWFNKQKPFSTLTLNW